MFVWFAESHGYGRGLTGIGAANGELLKFFASLRMTAKGERQRQQQQQRQRKDGKAKTATAKTTAGAKGRERMRLEKPMRSFDFALWASLRMTFGWF